MKQIHLILLILALFLSIIAKGQEYEGTIGNHEIRMNIEFYAKTIKSQYFYTSQLKDINLYGRIENDKLILEIETMYESGVNEIFELRKTGDTYKGTWKREGKELPVLLRKTATDAHDYKKSKLSFEREKVEPINGKEIVWIVEKYSKAKHFRLGNGFTKTQREHFNPILDRIQSDHSMDVLNCEEALFEIKPKLVSDQFISFTESSSIYCYGPHPSHGITTHNFDLIKLKEIENLSELYPDLDYYERIKKKYQDDPELEKECEYFEGFNSIWKYADWVLTNEGIEISPSFPHAMTPCVYPFLLTYDEIKR